ncbi:MAG: hypothetical protein GX649_05275, partial [Chloroflexi bacterium]|nr:hypothetical protein [Chloroflexota bacterium]
VALRDAGVPVAGGFDAPMEKECLRFLLRGTQPMLILRSPGQRPPRVAPAWRPAFAAGRLLLAAPFAEAPRRLTRRSAFQRNRVLVALSSVLFVVHAQPESYTESLVHEALKWGKPVYTLDLAENAHLLALGARPLGALGGPLSEAQ